MTAEALLAGVPVMSKPVGLLESAPHLARIVSRDAGAAEWAAAIKEDFATPQWRVDRAAEAQRVMQIEHSIGRFALSWRKLVNNVAQSSHA